MLRSSIKSLVQIQSRYVRHLHGNGSKLLNRLLLREPDSGFLKNVSKTIKLNVNPSQAKNYRYIHGGLERTTPTEDSVDKSLHRIDLEIRRTGRINRREIEEMLEDIRQLNSVTSNQSLMIIRCCGELVPEETFENRTKLVQEVWKTMENLKVPMDISHYNALLRVYLENEHKFNPSEFLEQLSVKGLEPNRVTYQRLIARFCQDGDIDGASTILQHMKEKQLPINLHVFNALILGHGQGGDMESAEGIIGVMKQAGLEPNDDTYVAMMRGYAKKGDFENIRRIVQECEQKEIYLVDRDFLEVIFTLAVSNNENLVKEVLPLLKRHSGFNQEASNVIIRLVTIGKEETALELLLQMPRAMKLDKVAPSGNFFIRQLVASNTPSSKVLKICHQMITQDIHKHAVLRACEFALDLKQFEKAFDFFEALKESGFPIRQHYFWPFFASSRSEKDVYDGLKCMTYMEISPTVETLRDYIIPALLGIQTTASSSIDFILEKLSNYSRIPSSTIVPAALQYILQTGKLEVAAAYALKYRIKFNHIGIRRALVDAYLKSGDAKAFVQIVGSTGIEGDDSPREAMGMLLTDLLENSRDSKKVPLLMPILNECLKNGVGLSNSSLEWIQNKLGEELTPDVSNIIIQLTSGDLSLNTSLYSSPPRSLVAFDEKSIPELEELLKVSTDLGKSTKGIKKALLIDYCRERQLEKAEAMYEELKSENFVFTSGIYALLMDLYSRENNLEKSREFYQNLGSRDFFILDDLKLLRYALLLMNNDQVDECIKLLKSQARDEKRIPQGAHQVSLVWNILNVVAEKGDVDKVKELFTILKERGLTNVNNVVLGPLVKSYLVKDDLDGALKEFEFCVNEYGVTPWKSELFCRFIKSDDADRLQKVMDLSTKQHGEVNSLYDLVFAFLECGKIRQAKKILETPGLRARNEKLEYTCQHYLEDGKIAELEKLIEITNGIFNVDRNSMYFFLLKAYCKQGDANKALSVWTSLQEENVQPSEELLLYLAKFLRENDLEVPFVVPEVKATATKTKPTETNPPTSEKKNRFSTQSLGYTDSSQLHKYLENNDLDKALELQQRLESLGKSFNVTDLSQLILKMTKAERLGEAMRLTEQMLQNGLHPTPSVLKTFVSKVAFSGEIETLVRLDSLLTTDLKRLVMLNSRLCTAYSKMGKGKDYFENYIKSRFTTNEKEALSANELIPVSAASYILRHNSELLPEFEELAASASDSKNGQSLYNVMWMYHLINKDFSKAREIMESHLKTSEEMLKFNSVVVEAKLNKDEELAKELGNQLLPLTTVFPAGKGIIVSSIIEVLCETGKATEGLEFLNSQLNKTVQLTDIYFSTLRILKTKLEESNVSFPHMLPAKTRDYRKGKKNESSSSSGSDSD